MNISNNYTNLLQILSAISISLKYIRIPSNITLYYIKQVTSLLDQNFTLTMILINFKPTNSLRITVWLKTNLFKAL